MPEYLRLAMECISQVAEGASPEELRRHAPGKWCAAEILEHLSRAFSSTVKLLERHLAAGEPAERRATSRERWWTLLVIEAGYFPGGRAAPAFTLPQGIEPEQALPRFRETLLAMDDALARCEQKFGRDARIAAHAIFGPLTARQWRKFHWVHTRHHARQVARLIPRSR